MEVIRLEQIDLKKYAKTSDCKVYFIHVKLKDIKSRAGAIISSISNTSWIDALDSTNKITYAARAQRTINKLVEDIFNKVEDIVTKEFGEYLVSETARTTLENEYAHIIVPLAELWKEKLSENPGFDFHTVTHTDFIAFGESKYSGSDTPYGNAIKQMGEMIDIGKDSMDLAHLQWLIEEEPVNNFKANKKAFIAAFSLNSSDYDKTFKNVITSKYIDKLLEQEELYLIGIEVCR